MRTDWFLTILTAITKTKYAPLPELRNICCLALPNISVAQPGSNHHESGDSGDGGERKPGEALVAGLGSRTEGCIVSSYPDEARLLNRGRILYLELSVLGFEVCPEASFKNRRAYLIFGCGPTRLKQLLERAKIYQIGLSKDLLNQDAPNLRAIRKEAPYEWRAESAGVINVRTLIGPHAAERWRLGERAVKGSRRPRCDQSSEDNRPGLLESNIAIIRRSAPRPHWRYGSPEAVTHPRRETGRAMVKITRPRDKETTREEWST